MTVPGGGAPGSRGRHAPALGPDPLLARVRDRMLAYPEPVTAARLAAAVQASGSLLGSEGTLRAVDRVRAEIQGLGVLQPLALLPGVSDILVNGPDQVWVDAGRGLERTAVRFAAESDVQALAVRLVAAAGRRLDDSSPCVDVQLQGYRVHAVLAPVSTGSTLLSIRIHRNRTFSLAELAGSGMMDPQCEAVLRRILRRRLNFLVSGATGTGKTTLLSALLSLSGKQERLVLVEDAAELNPVHPHVVGLQSRHGNVEGSGILDQAELVRQALRMRPDRLVVGECRGAEVRELLAALNTGHDGAGGTIHANSAAGVPARLTALGALAGMTPDAVELQAAAALDVVIHLHRAAAGRTVSEIAVLGRSGGRLAAIPALVRTGTGYRHGEGWTELERRLEERGSARDGAA
ncbi:TadA family conjugal transfer-associated ATPase [Arthrobacter yangruifuii]|uniref:TadA family conjugal transfer-associated ATPase n=1 Tax=Arthrobacter yangruifuii TaxID=2606616 RepID=A0A5N6MTM1_9MICC|nr:TadA family conjugal transfer-associated ATPase [Arthrobacter yangruifuii]KAD4060146.1 TadA family conjugal transfer-associated ATPase [Arthrobacter yangruifuii]